MAHGKYYWLKLKDDFFRKKEIKKLRRIAGGDTYTIIYLKLQLMSLEHEGKILFEHVEDTLSDEIALAIDEDNENVAVTLAFLEKNHLIELVETDEYILPKVLTCIGSESESAERVRKYRAKRKTGEINSLPCNETVLQSNGKTLHVTQRREELERREDEENKVESETTSETSSESDQPEEKSTDVSDDVVDDDKQSLTHLKKLYEENIIHRPMSNSEQAQFLGFFSKYGYDELHEAIVKAAENQAGGINYIGTVLQNGDSYSPEKWKAEHNA